jgi:opacity protein-like surface antigen
MVAANALAATVCCAQIVTPLENVRQSPNEFVQQGSVYYNAQCWDNACDGDTGRHYFSAFAGFDDVDNFERTLRTGTTKRIDGAKLKDGWAAGATIGRRSNTYGRLEFEFTFRDNSVKSWFEQQFNSSNTLTSNTILPAFGTVQSYSGVVNVVFDLSEPSLGQPNLYLGGGLGSIYLDANFFTAANTYEAHDSSFAYQFIAGVDYPIRPQVSLFSEYRYLGADYLRVNNITTGQSLGDFAIDTHNIFFGVRLGR